MTDEAQHEKMVPLSKVRLGEKKIAVRTRTGGVLGTNSLLNTKGGAKKCDPNRGCAVDTGVSWTRGG